jgi:hypothetical protein
LITQRDHVSAVIKRDLSEKAAGFHILLDDVSITHLNFGREYTSAVESKQIAQQDAERSKFVVEQAKQVTSSKAQPRGFWARVHTPLINGVVFFLIRRTKRASLSKRRVRQDQQSW